MSVQLCHERSPLPPPAADSANASAVIGDWPMSAAEHSGMSTVIVVRGLRMRFTPDGRATGGAGVQSSSSGCVREGERGREIFSFEVEER